MAQVINTNTMSLNAQRNLSTSGSSLATTIQRLSSGSRINSAKDDAAGLAISERFGTQIRGTDVAIRNANDGISLAQVAEGSLTEIGNNLQRIRELAVQSSNATNSASDRKALQAEVTQLKSEIDRVAKQSEFNGTKLLDGSFSSQLFQVGANAGQAIAIDKVVDAKADALGNAAFDDRTLAITATGIAAADKGKTISYDGLTIGGGGLAAGIKIDKVEVTSTGVIAEDQKALVAAVTTAINAKIGEAGIYAEVGANAGEITLTSVKESIDSSGNFAGMTVSAGTGTLTGAAGTVAIGSVALTAGPAKAGKMLSDVNIDSVKGAQQALEVVDKALGAINSTRADLGAIQNRFTSVVANLQTSTENLSASRSRIKDTDFAKETAELTRTQILQQAGTAMLAQANQVPQGVLSLLR
ncbi:flagellin [Stenotrophomonas maltophilia]|uniref:flagellin n=1 Tax=Stenotrophomonas maltophilia group TaxID=995085 RepID=UPI0015DF2E78|nr:MULTISPECIES: flagellin [Stenotrophomonas maltophilia group]MBA0265506.1 flagellin [Stenotrophomonas maltophilia]MBA0467451.1 flagellin [Stenotrophomonas maltophilia]MBA0477422.1 flagellin [Stenotrophomonas maltophilia]MBA0485246.1 flagellin [Stenotrophomonas maltophilia]MDT3557254.1 flagellin [Stenotrophomonas maltophilia group sp. msm1]